MKQEDYDKVKDKYDLPSFEEISSEFEICAIDVNKVNSLVRAILKVMGTKMGVFLNYLEPVINPSPQGLHAYIEVENTTNDEKKSIFEFYKILSYKYHKSYSLELIGEEELVAKEIKLILKDWSSTKNKFKVLCEIINRAWKKEREKEQIETVG